MTMVSFRSLLSAVPNDYRSHLKLLLWLAGTVSVSDCLDMSKVNAGLVTLELVPFALEETLRHVMVAMGQTAKQKVGLDDSYPKLLSAFPLALTIDHR